MKRLYSIVYRKINSLRRRLSGRTQRIALGVSLTRFCNAKCIMCPMHSQMNAMRSHMDDKTFYKVVSIFKKLGYKFIMLHSMGECLAHPNFKTYVNYLLKEHFAIRISTNSSYIHRHMDTLLKVHYLKISLEGWDKESMRHYRGQDFDLVYQNVKEFWKFSRHKIDFPIRLIMHVYPSMTTENIQKMVEVWGPFVDVIVVGFPYNPKLNHEVKEIAPIPRSEFGDYHYMVPKKGPFMCERSFRSAFFQPNGDVVPCCDDYAGLLTLGNIHEKDFMSIFNGERAQKLRKEFLDGNPVSCGNCVIFYEFEDDVKKKLQEVSVMVKKHHEKIKKAH